jgi:hypothetical protein
VLVEPDGTAAVWKCWRCQWKGTTRRAADGREGFRPRLIAERAAAGPDASPEWEPRRERARELWRAARPITEADLAGRYLINRGLFPPWPLTLRFGAYTGTGTRNRWPAMITAAAQWPDRRVAAVQVTPLREPGVKAWARPSRLTFGTISGAAVRLSPWSQGQPVALTEGTEDALAILAALPDLAVWAVLGAGNAAKVLLPPGSDAILALDGDERGRAEAHAAVRALWARGHRVRVAELPDGDDPLDLLRRAGP